MAGLTLGEILTHQMCAKAMLPILVQLIIIYKMAMFHVSLRPDPRTFLQQTSLSGYLLVYLIVPGEQKD